MSKKNRNTGLIDEMGNVYGKLTVIARGNNEKGGTARWVCKCECGKIRTVGGQHLRNGNASSCGRCPKFEKKRVRKRGNIYEGKKEITEPLGDLLLKYAAERGDWFVMSDFSESIGWHSQDATPYAPAKRLVKQRVLEVAKMSDGGRFINHYRAIGVVSKKDTKQPQLPIATDVPTVVAPSQTPEQNDYERGREDMALFFAQKFLDEQAAKS